MFNVYIRLRVPVNSLGIVLMRNSRMVARRPVRVHLPKTDKAKKTLDHYEEILVKKKKNAELEKAELKSIHEKETRKTSRSVPDIKHEIQHQLLSEAKENIRKLLSNVSSRKYREQHGLFVTEGIQIIKEALSAGVHPEAIFFTRLNQLMQLVSDPAKFGLEELCTLNTLPLYRTPYNTLQTWSSLTTSPGIIGVFKVPTPPTQQPEIPVSLVLDQIREPANLGGILRTAASVGLTHVILMKGCCDPWERKTVRAGCGAHFRLRITTKATWDTLTNQLPEDMQLLVADVCRDRDLEMEQEDNMKEKHLYQKKTNNLGTEIEVTNLEEETAIVYEIDSKGNKLVIDPSYDDEEYLQKYKNIQLPFKYYDGLKVHPSLSNSSGGTVVVIGGETGLSNSAKKFATVNSGLQVAIPLANGMESLNSSVATGIILYEISRQHRQQLVNTDTAAERCRNSSNS